MSCCNGQCNQVRACPARANAAEQAAGAAVVARARRLHADKFGQDKAVAAPVQKHPPEIKPAQATLNTEPGLWAHWGYWVAVGVLVLLSVGIVTGAADHLYARWFA